jgi:hypothetical protein
MLVPEWPPDLDEHGLGGAGIWRLVCRRFRSSHFRSSHFRIGRCL